jgi:hypothetical protein
MIVESLTVERTSSRAGVVPAEVQRLSRRTVSPIDLLNSPVASLGGFAFEVVCQRRSSARVGLLLLGKRGESRISAPPHAVTSLSGGWGGSLTRQEVSALGTHTVYWVWFDEPQFDADGDGPYSGGQVWDSA